MIFRILRSQVYPDASIIKAEDAAARTFLKNNYPHYDPDKFYVDGNWQKSMYMFFNSVRHEDVTVLDESGDMVWDFAKECWRFKK